MFEQEDTAGLSAANLSSMHIKVKLERAIE